MFAKNTECLQQQLHEVNDLVDMNDGKNCIENNIQLTVANDIDPNDCENATEIRKMESVSEELNEDLLNIYDNNLRNEVSGIFHNTVRDAMSTNQSDASSESEQLVIDDEESHVDSREMNENFDGAQNGAEYIDNEIVTQHTQQLMIETISYQNSFNTEMNKHASELRNITFGVKIHEKTVVTRTTSRSNSRTESKDGNCRYESNASNVQNKPKEAIVSSEPMEGNVSSKPIEANVSSKPNETEHRTARIKVENRSTPESNKTKKCKTPLKRKAQELNNEVKFRRNSMNERYVPSGKHRYIKN